MPEAEEYKKEVLQHINNLSDFELNKLAIRSLGPNSMTEADRALVQALFPGVQYTMAVLAFYPTLLQIYIDRNIQFSPFITPDMQNVLNTFNR